MEILVVLLSALAALGVGAGAGYLVHGRRLRRNQLDAEATIVAAQAQASRIAQEGEAQKRAVVQQAEEEARRQRTTLDAEQREWRSELQRQERRMGNREEGLERRSEGLDRRERAIGSREGELEVRSGEIEGLKKQHTQALEAVASLTAAEARDHVLRAAEEATRHELARQYYELNQRFKEESDVQARKLLAESMQRLASDVVSEATITVVPLPNDEMKGRLIGREGRNIRAIEQATGVDLIIDDTPEAVTISCFDPVRREVARLALAKLISDGRVHPGRIEETVEKARQEVERVTVEAGERAALEVGVTGIPQELIKLLGRLYYRTSYSQNVLKHSIELAFVGGMIATEVGADVQVVKTGAILHDIGKALSHEVEGPHAEIGADIARKHGMSEAVCRCIREHHGPEQTSLESAVVQTADTVSAARPGARRDTLERYTKRLEELEAVANSFPGIEKCYAIQAGREVRIIVKPEQVDDVSSAVLARDVAKRIQEKLAFPGQIKVVVIRETRSTEYAR